MKTLKYTTSILLLFFLGNVIAQQIPAAIQSNDFSIEGATLHIGNGETIENSLIMFSNGKIEFVGSAKMKIGRRGTVISAIGKHIYPGFIATNSSLGLIEIEAVRASRDQDEVGEMTPHVRSLIAYNTESKVVESMRPNGVLIAQISPKGGRVSGTSSIVQFDAWNWEDAVIKADDGIHVNWPNSFSWNRAEKAFKTNKEYTKQVDKLNSFFLSSKTYNKGNITIVNLPFQAMKGVFDGSKKLYIHVDDEKGIVDAINFKIKNNIPQMVIVGGYQANKVSAQLVKNQIPVLLTPTQSLPESDDDDYDFPYKLPKILMNDGVLVGIQSGDNSNFQTRNLPFYAGQVAGQGLDKEKALQLITYNTAKILGIDKDYGSIEVGKSATLFISEGDALDMRTNNLTDAFIDGRLISLETHQTQLWNRYSEKYKSK